MSTSQWDFLYATGINLVLVCSVGHSSQLNGSNYLSILWFEIRQHDHQISRIDHGSCLEQTEGLVYVGLWIWVKVHSEGNHSPPKIQPLPHILLIYTTHMITRMKGDAIFKDQRPFIDRSHDFSEALWCIDEQEGYTEIIRKQSLIRLKGSSFLYLRSTFFILYRRSGSLAHLWWLRVKKHKSLSWREPRHQVIQQQRLWNWSVRLIWSQVRKVFCSQLFKDYWGKRYLWRQRWGSQVCIGMQSLPYILCEYTQK